MRFKTSDLGLYFALALTGAGVGLLVGALIASKYNKEEAPEPIEFPESKEVPVKNKKIKTKKSTRQEVDPEFLDFIEEWEPNQMQIQMYKNGLVTKDELMDLIIRQRSAEYTPPHTYNAIYIGDDFDGDKPDLEDLVSDDDLYDYEKQGLIDDKYLVLLGYDGPMVNKRIVWDPSDNGFFYLSTRGNPVPLGDLDAYISESGWNHVRTMLIANRPEIIYVEVYEDRTLQKTYSFELIEGAMEDDLTSYILGEDDSDA